MAEPYDLTATCPGYRDLGGTSATIGPSFLDGSSDSFAEWFHTATLPPDLVTVGP